MRRLALPIKKPGKARDEILLQLKTLSRRWNTKSADRQLSVKRVTGDRHPFAVHWVITSSTRRFCCRPAAVLFVAIGIVSPLPTAMMMSPGMPADTR